MKIKKTKTKGFTLTEMLVVVMVIAVLAAIAYPLYTKAATKSRAIEAINLLEMVRNKQLQKYAEDRVYYSSFTNMGQLTANKRQETLSAQELKVKDYTLSLNNVHSCMTAKYEKGNTTFSFSSSYEQTGLGCTGDVCSSFGDIVGTAKDVCNCGSKSCSNGYTLNEDTCNCDCYLGCDQSGTCFAPYGGGLTRACATGCGTQSSASSCGGSVWSGSCWSPTQTLPTNQTCGNSGTQTRTCTANCTGGSCGSWGACTGQTCPSSSKPSTTQSCGNCGTQTRTVTCNTNTGSWESGAFGTCTGAGVCAAGTTQSCGTGGTQTCSSSCAWGTCGGQACPSSTKPATSQACGNCNTGTQTRTVTCNTSTYTWTSGAWSTCTGAGECAAGATQTCNSTGTQTCSSTCTWGTCSVVNCDTSTKPVASQSCGNCNKGTQTRTVTCNTSTGTWTTTAWSTCTGAGECAAGATQTCNSTGTQTCSSSCTWGTCSVTNCDSSTKPATSQACGNCNQGTQTRTVTCNTSTGTWTTTSWSTCSGGGTCSPGSTQLVMCGTNTGYNQSGTESFIYKEVTCTSSCTWPSVAPCNHCVESPNCGKKFANGQIGYCYCDQVPMQDFDCSNSMPIEFQDCGYCGTQERQVTCDRTTGTWQIGEWGVCSDLGECSPGTTQSCGPHAQQTCTNSCTWGVCKGSCAQAQRPIDTQNCGNCSTGTQTRSVTCDTSSYTWVTGSWGSCLGGGTCAAGATQSCGGGYGTQTCSSSCSWGTCTCNNGYQLINGVCVRKALDNDCCCNGNIEIHRDTGLSCNDYNYTPRLMACRCADKDECDQTNSSLCTDCGGTWNSTRCTCDCGFYNGNACTFTSGGCLCGNLYRNCI